VNRRMLLMSAAIVLLACAALVPGCDRKPRLVPADNDSTTAIPDDPYEIMVRNAGRLWDAGSAEDAAALTARVLRVDLRDLPPETWEKRAVSLLDSMNVGAEVESDECAIVANLFSRANPTGASWPFVVWCEADSARQQPLEGQGLRLLQFAARDVNGPAERRGLAVLFGRGVAAGVMPTLLVWKAAGSGWKLVQTLGPDSLGGTGSGRFDRSPEAIDLVTMTFRVSSGFTECASCPHVETERRFRWQGDTFVRVDEKVTQTPYATFVKFIQSLRAADYVSALGFVSDRNVLERALEYGWSRDRILWRVAPGTEERSRQMTFLHGQTEAYRVWFEPRGEGWAISSVDTTGRTLDEL